MKQLLLILILGVLYSQSHSLNFDGENDYLIVNHSEDYTLQEELTISTWIYPHSYDNSANPWILGLGSGDYGNWLCFSDPGIQFKIEGVGSITSSIRPPLNQWSHIVAIMSTDSLKIYANNILIAGMGINGGVIPENFISESYIGTQNGVHDLFDGQIFTLNLWNRALSISEINQIFNHSDISIQNSLEMSFGNFDEGFESSLIDLSGNQNNGNAFGVTVSTNIPSIPTYTNIPDDNFEQALIDLGYDDVLDDYVYTENISGLENLTMQYKSITDLTGIEGFTSIKNLNISDNNLQTLDLTSNTLLEFINCNVNSLTSLNINGLSSLKNINSFGNQLTQIDLSTNTALEELHLRDNLLTNLDLTSNIELNTLSLNGNQISSIDLSNNSLLYYLKIDNLQLSTIDLSNNGNLEVLEVHSNQLTSLDISNNIKLTDLNCSGNQLQELDVSNNLDLINLYCQSNQLGNIDIASNDNLSKLYLSENQLTNIDVSTNSSLKELYVDNNLLVSLDASNLSELTHLICHNNILSSIDVTNCTSLELFAPAYNQLTNIDLSTLTSLYDLDIKNNLITSLDVRNSLNLYAITARENQLTDLDLSNNTNLNWIQLYDNNLAYLNMRNGLKEQVGYFNTQNNNLVCIETLDPDWASANWVPENGNYFFDENVTFKVVCSETNQDNYYVSANGNDASGDGTVDSPFKTIQTAINVAADGNTVNVAPGTYYENINFNGKNISVIGESMWNTIVDGGGFDAVVKFENYESSESSMKNFTIQNGGFSGGEYPEFVGGGVLIQTQASPTLSFLRIINNHSERVGGGIYLSSSNATISNCIIRGNQAGGEGGGIGIGGENSPVIKNCLIADNFGYSGGGIFVEGNGNYVFANLTIVNNSSQSWTGGGGIFASRLSNSILVNSILWDNKRGEIDDQITVDAFNVDEGSVSSLMVVNTTVENGLGGIVVENGSTLINQGIYSFNPMFIGNDEYFENENNNSYELDDISPAISAGVNAYEFNDNSYIVTSNGGLLGVSIPTPETSLADLGAFENINGISNYVGDTYYVDATSNYGNGSIDNPFPSIQAAINTASNGNTINVAPGTYYENINFSGKNIFVVGADSSNTIIDGGQNGSVVLFENGEDTTAVLKNFTIQNGNAADDATHYNRGGGVYVNSMAQETSAKLENLLIKSNSALHGGGGVALYVSGELVIRNCSILNNNGGGVLFLRGAKAYIYNSLIDNNYGTGYGGGLMVTNTSLDMKGCTISNNVAGLGGGFNIENVTGEDLVEIKTTIIENNTATWGHGGGIYNSNAVTTLVSSIVRNNTANNDMGGGIYTVGGGQAEMRIIESIVKGNTAQIGGGISAEGFLYISKSQVVNNSASHQIGGIRICCGMDSEIYNSTISDNNSNNASGNGISLVGGEGSLILKNSILWNDGDYEIKANDSALPWNADIEYSIIKNGFEGIENQGNHRVIWGEGNLSSDPLLDGGTYQFVSGSPAIDSGHPHPWFNDHDGSRNDIGFSGGSGTNISTTELDLGFVAIGSSAENTISVHSNKNYGGIVIDQVVIDEGPFELGSSLPIEVGQYSTEKIYFTFSPSNNGLQSQLVTMTYDGTNPGDFTLSGFGIDLSDGLILVPGEVSSIQEAIDLANDGDTVSVAAGTYYENIEIPNKKLYVIGQDRETTIIDGRGISSVVNIWGADAGNDITLKGFTLQNGVGKPIDPGTHNNNNCGGGIVVANPASPLLTDLIIQNNAVNGAGGGIFVENGATLRLSNSIVRTNESGSGEDGGGINMDGGTMGYIHNTEVYNNFASKSGGGIYADSPLYITNSIIRDNRCLDGQGNGLAGRVYMYNCVVTQNGWESDIEFGYTGNHSMQIFPNSKIWNSIIWGNLGENKIGNNVNVSIDYSIVEGGLGGGIIDTQTIIWGSHNSSLNPQFNNPENYDFTPNPQTAGHVLNNGDPNQFFNNSDGTQNHIGHTGGVGIIVFPTELEFGNVAVGYDIAKSIDIVNNTNSVLTISSVNSSSSEVDLVGWQSLPRSVSLLGKTGIGLQTLALSSGDISASVQLQFDHPVIADNNGFISVTAKAYDLPNGDIIVPTDFSSIQLALDIIPSDTEKTIMVEPGEYFENIVLRRVNNVTIKSQAGPFQTIINGGENDIVIDSDASNRAGGITIDGFTVTGGAGGAIDVYHTHDNITLRNLIIKGNHGNGVSRNRSIVIVSPQNTILENVVIAGNQHSQEIVDQNYQSALEIAGSADFDHTTKIINCTIVDNDQLSGVKVQNWGGDAKIFFLNTVVWGNTQNIIIHSDGNPLVYFDDSMVANPSGTLNPGGNGTLTFHSCDDEYPYFNDLDNGDYSLSSFSPLIGAGTTFTSVPETEIVLYAPSEDILGNPRPSPSGSNPDIGAYENNSSEVLYNPNKYVSIYGDNNNPGIITSPWRDIQYALDNANSGDIIHIGAGQYNENIVLTQENLTILGESRETTIINGNQSGTVVTIPTGRNGATVKNLTIKNGTGRDALYGVSGGGIYVESISTLDNLIVEENSATKRGGGVYFEGGSGISVLSNSIVRNNLSEQGAGISVHNGSNPTIKYTTINNNIASSGGGGALLTSYSSTFINSTIANNTAPVGAGLWMNISDVNDYIDIINTNITGNEGDQIEVGFYAGGGANISYSNVEGGLDNIVFNESNIGTLNWNNGNLNVPPFFVDTENNDFHLLASSKLINAGHPDSSDSDGTRSDIGAYFYYNTYSGPIWYVATDGNNIDGTGSNESKFASIQAAINFANNGDSIFVASGTYYENINMRSKIVKVVGANYQNTIIDGNQSGSVITFMNEAHGALIKNFTIQNGQAVYDPSEWEQTFGAAGGGIRTAGSRPFLENLIIKNNSAHLGGGIYYHGGNLSNPIRTKFKNVVIVNNTAAKGGGIYCQDDVNDIFYGVSIINNLATDQNGGGGINSNWNSPVTIVNSIITGNETIISGENVPNQLAVNGGQCSFTVSFSNIDGGQEGVFLSNTDNNQLVWGVGNVGIDSKMENIEQGKYNLLASSMLVNAGHPDSLDSDGTIADIGAFPYLNTFSGPTWYVKTDGSDLTGKGSSEEPFRSIQSAINFSDSGDSVSVFQGSYQERIHIAHKNIDIVGAGIDQTIINGELLGMAVVLKNSDSYIEGFTITNGYREGYVGNGLNLWQSDATIKNCRFINNKDGHLGIGATNDAKFVNCLFLEQNETSWPINVDNGLRGGDFINCLVDANGNNNAFISNGYPSLMNCTIFNYSDVAYDAGGAGTATIINSVFLPTQGYPGATVARSEGIQNIGITIDHSIFPEEGVGYSTETGSVTYGENNITGYPVFVDTTANNYRLGDLSPAISAGTSSFVLDGVAYNAPINDLEGNIRPNPSGSDPDMGAYESPRGLDPSYDGPVWYVEGTGVPYANGGPGAPYSTIMEGISAAEDGDTVFVREGTYIENIDFGGKDIVVVGEDREATVIDGGQSGSVARFQNGETNEAVLENFTLINGSDTQGGGVYITTASPTLRNLIISQNSASSGGGISIDNQCNVVMTNLIVRNNTATERGGGVFAWGNVTLSLNDSEISNNSAPHAGGVFLGYSIVPQIDNCTIAGNTATDYGGGVVFQNLLESDNVILTETNVAGNSAPVGSQLYVASYPNTWEEGNSPRTTISYSNIQQDNENDYFESDEGIVSWLGGNINVDPNFIDVEDSNYGILASSMLVNSGNPDSIDSDGTRSDIGARPYLNSYNGPSWFVTETGSDTTGTGSAENPFASIQAGINFSINGHTVNVGSGTYVENIYNRSKAISIIGENKVSTVIDGSNGGINDPTAYLDGDVEDHITLLQDLTLTGGDGGIRVESGSEGIFRINQCVIQDNDAHGWGDQATALGVFSGNVIHLENSIITNQNTDTYPLISIGSNGGGKIHIDRCVITDNKNSHIFKLKGNTGNASMVVTNSVIWENESELLSIEGSYNHADISYNNIDTNLVSFIDDTDTLAWGPGNVNVDPRFVDADNGDFHIYASSQMINGGVPNQTDSDGTRADIGLHPYLNLYQGPKWYVSQEGNDLSANGSNEDPFRSIQAALSFGSDGDTALVSAGTYNENLVYRYDEAESVRSVNIAGESRNETIIDANNTGPGIFFPMNGYSSPTISNITIQNGFGNDGGGVHVAQNYHPIFINNTSIKSCSADGSGGAIYAIGSSVNLSNVLLEQSTSNSGGAIYYQDGVDPVSYDLNITNSQIVNNNSSGAGGGLYLVSGNVLIKNTDIMNNYAGGSGGGIFEDHTDLTNLSIVGSRITGNVTNSDGGGIGLSNEGYTIIRRTLIANNQSASWGAGIFTNHEFELSNSIIIGNIGGTGISFHSDRDTYVVNSIIRENPNGNVMFDIYSQSEDTDIIFQYNNIEGRSFEFLYSDNNTAQLTDNTMNVDYEPDFIDPENGNYQIFSSCLSINAGHQDSTDNDGTVADIGIYPYLNDYSGPDWFITEDGNDITADGSIDSPFRSIQSAVNFGSDGDTAYVADGTYNETIVYRNFIGKSVNILGESIENTIIDPNQDDAGVRISWSSLSPIQIANLSIQNAGGIVGAGIDINGLNLSPINIENLHIKNCSSETAGGAIKVTSNNQIVSIENVLIENNDASAGGGIYFSPFGDGSNSSLTISNTILKQNSTSSRGGGIWINNGSNLSITNSEFVSNSAEEIGGGIYSHNGVLGSVFETQIRNNIAPEGAGFFIETSSFDIERSVFYANEGGHGSALEMFQSNVNVVNSNFINNMNNNEWGLNSGAIFFNSSPSTFELINSVVANNADFEIIGQYPNDGTNELFIDYSSIQGGNNFLFSGNSNVTWGSGNIELDPLFVDFENNNYQLQQDSPLIDAGHPDSLDIDGTRSDIGALIYDQTGLPLRVQNLKTVQKNQRVELTWDTENQVDENQYNIYRSFDINEDWYNATPYSTTNSPIYVESSPAPDQTYFYRVSAVDSDGDEGLLGFMEHHRLGVDSTSILLKGFDATVNFDQLIIPEEVQYTLEGFFKYTNDESPEDLFGFQTELILKKSVEGDSIRLSLDLPQVQESSEESDLSFMVDSSSWHHIAIVGNEENTVVWIDGTPAITTAYLVYGGNFSFSSGQQIDEMRFSYSALYAQPFVPVAGFGFDETTFGYWRMNEGSLDSEFPALYDISGNSNHIVLVERPGALNDSAYMQDVPHRNDIENALTINEVMPNPAGSDGGKEWLEVYNSWFTPIHLGGWTLEGGSTTESHVVDGNVKIPSGGYSLLGQSSDIESNGGYDPDYEYGTTISLSNFGEALSIKDGSGQIIDAVDFDDTFPFSSGASMELIRPDYDNSLAVSWLAAGLPYGASGNMGTPGEKNAAFSGTFVLASAALDYGYVTEGTETQLSFWILNDGVADLVIDSMMNQTEYFTLTPTSGVLLPGDSLEVSVLFSPETVQIYSDTVTVFTDDPYNPTSQISFVGSSINEFADIVVNGAGNDSLSSYQFPFTRLGFTRTLRLDIVNIGTPDLEIEEIILEGDSEFSIDIDASILSFLDTLSLSVVYEPSEEGSNTATLIFGSNDPDEPSYTMSLFGQAAENIILFVPSEYPTIAAAIDSAYQQDTIEVAPGTYSGGLSLLDKNLVFRGGGDPIETMLQGDGTGPVLTIDGGQNATTKISNFTILGGGGTQGGGIKIDGGASPSLDHVIVAANAASGSGGGIAVLSGGADMSNMTITYNSSVGSGGAVYAAVGASVNIDNSILFGNGSTEIGSFGNVNTTYSIISGGVDGEGNMDVDPLFVNGPALDFSLSWESMAIDAGDPDYIPDDDGTTLDIGALPYNQTLQPPDAVTAFSGTGGNGQIELTWGYPLDPRGNANGDIVDLVLMRAVASDLFDTLAVLNDTDSIYTDTGQDGHLVNGQEYHYVVVPRDTLNLESPTNDTLTIIPVGGTIALMDSDTTNDFGTVDHDQTSMWELLIENTGNGDLSLPSIEVSSTWYSVSDASMMIPAGGTDTLSVTFDPDLTPGTLLDTIVINTDDLDAPVLEIELSGTSAWPVLALSDDEIDYGDVRVDLIETLVLDISNDGTDTLFVDSIFVQDSLSGFTVAISEGRTSSRIANILHPLLSKRHDNHVSVNQGGVENQDSTKSSSGRRNETIQGSRDIGTNPEEDLGTRPRPGGLMGSVHSDGSKQLVNDRNNQSRIHLSVEVMPGESIGLDVSFSRPDTATVSTTLEITSDDPLGNGDLSIPLNGHSVAPVLSLSSESHLFGNVLDSADYVFTITNTGTDTLNISEFDVPLAAFSQIWEGPTATVLEPGAFGELTLTFSPELSGYYEVNLTILSDTYLTGNSVIGLSGLKIPLQNIDFSGVLLGEDSVQVLSFENNGNVDLTISTISVESSSDFSTDISTNFVLPVDATGQLNVTFQPSARGPATGNIIFTTPASPNDIVAVSSTGEGWIPPTAEFAATSISVVTYQGNDLSFDLEVTNSGDYQLNYASSVSADFAGWVWLETVSTGQILGTTDSTILVNVVNTANLDPGIYNGNIYFDTNTGQNPSELVSGTHVMDIFLNLLGDDSQITDTTVTIPSGNTPPITFTDENGESIGLVLDFVNSAGGTVTVQGVSTLPPVDENTPFVDPDGLVTDPVYPAQYYEISTDIEGNFVTDIGLSYSILPGIDSPNTLRLAKRPGNSGTLEPWQLIAVADTEVDTVNGQVVAKNQSSFSQWALISNSTDNSFMDIKGPTATSLNLNPVEPGVLMDAQVSVNVSDDTGIESVILYYAPGGSDSYSSTAMVNDGQGTYSGTIPGSSVTQSGLLYYVMSQDVLGFSSSSDTLGAAVNFASGTLTTNSASGSAYPTGLPLDAWRLISTPAVLNETGLTQVFDELGTQDNTVWRVFRYDDVSNTYKDNPVDLNSTESYWIYQKTEDNLTMDTPAGKTGDMAGTEITLKTGWNFIGSPYPFQVPLQLDQVQFYGPLTYGISGESWSPVVTELDPWNGYVVYNRMSTDQIITLDPSIGSGTTVARKVEESGWLVSLELSSGTHGDHINTLGALETAEDALEWHDNPEIRSPGSGVSLFFKLEGEALELTSDIRSLGQQVNVWDMHIRSDTDSDVDLSWSVIQDLPADVDIRLVDLSTRKVLNMKSETQLFFGTLDSRYDRRVKIVAGDESDVAAKIGDVLSMIPEELSISGNYPNPFNPSTTIRYGLPEPRNVRMTIVNIRGQQIAELVSGWKDMGQHEVVWNGRNDDGSSLSSGIYFVVINDGTNFRTHKVMLLK